MPDRKFLFKGEFDNVDVEKKVAYGWAYVSKVNEETVVDHSGQTWDIDEVRKTAHRFVCECREGGESHVFKGGAKLVESLVLTKDLQEALGIDLKKEGWFVGFRIDDESLLSKVAEGKLPMFSIGGVGYEEKIDAES